MKRIISFALAFVIAAGCCTAAFAGKLPDKGDISANPVIIVAGYGSSNLIVTNEDGTEEQCWYPDFDDIKAELLRRMAEIGIGLGAAAFNQPEYLAKLLGEEVIRYLEKTKCNDDGSSTYNTRLMFGSAKESNDKYLGEKYGDDSYRFEVDLTHMLLDYLPEEKIFNFNVDWRMGAVQCAKDLDKYIQEVKALCKCRKVNIFSISHGGQVTGTYLALFGSKCDIDNAVMTVPALGGAGVIYDLFTQTIKFDELNLLYFIEHGTMTEDDYHWLVEAQQLGFLDNVLNMLIPYLFEVAGHWGSIWDFCPTDIYEAMKEKWLDPVKNKKLIEKSDYMHYTVMPSFYTKLKKCNTDYGMNVSIIAGTDINMTTGSPVSGDGIIFAKSSTGADCTDVGKRFPDGYVQKNYCGGRYKVSPQMTVDASTAYMPDNTWFVSGLFHGMMIWEEYTRNLQFTLLLTDKIKNVYSDPDYPQFHTSANSSYAVSAVLNSSSEGYASDKDTALKIKNLSLDDRRLMILGVDCSLPGVDFALKGTPVIKAGETLEIALEGKLPQESNSRFDITVNYCVIGSLTPLGQRTFAFTLLNGKKKDGGKEQVSSDAVTPIEGSAFSFMNGALKKTDTYNFFALWYNTVYGLLKPLIKFLGIRK